MGIYVPARPPGIIGLFNGGRTCPL